jgi:hypothetical protein
MSLSVFGLVATESYILHGLIASIATLISAGVAIPACAKVLLTHLEPLYLRISPLARAVRVTSE